MSLPFVDVACRRRISGPSEELRGADATAAPAEVPQEGWMHSTHKREGGALKSHLTHHAGFRVEFKGKVRM